MNEIIENAILLDSASFEEDDKSPNSFMMHSLYALSDSGEGVELIKLYVDEIYAPNSEDTIKRAYKLNGYSKIRMKAGSGLGINAYSTSNSTGHRYTISDLFSLVKQNDKYFQPKAVSIVVDANGIPKPVYHSTDAKFDTFDITKSRSWDGTPDYDLPGFYFSESFDDSAAYGGNVGEYYIKIEKPYEGNVYALAKEKGSYRKAYEYLIVQGYDGVIDDELGEGFNEYIVLKPENIKSATDNIGTFDINDMNTLYSDRQNVTVFDIIGENERIKSENEILRADIERLNEMLRLEKQVTKGRYFNNNSLLSVWLG